MSREQNRDDMAAKALNLSAVIQRGMLEHALSDAPDDSVLKKAITSGVRILKSVHDTRWPASIISDTDTPGERLMRSLGLCMLDVPEIVMYFKVADQDFAMGVFEDLVHTAIADPEEARGKIFPGRRVHAFRFGRNYYMHCAVEKCTCDICTNDDAVDTSAVEPECSSLWNVSRLFVDKFRAVQIILAPPEAGAPAINPPDGPRCSACNVALPAQHKLCACRAVAYCGKECQVKHWRVHKVMCARNPSIGEQLHEGDLCCGVRM